MSPIYKNERWHQIDQGPEMAEALVSLCTALESEQENRRTRCKEALGRYEMRRLPGLDAGAYGNSAAWSGDNYDSLVWAYERSIANSAQAKIAGTQKPKVQFVTTDADWGTKRKSKKLDRFVEGQFMQPFGAYCDVWALMIRIFLDACVFPTGGAVKITSDLETGRVNYERVFSWELYVDPTEARYGNPRNLFHIFPYDRDELLELYPDHADQIEKVNLFEDKDSRLGTSSRISNQVKVFEAWRLPLSAKKPGRHVIAINGCVLLDEEWTRDEFPFLWIRWAQNLLGFDGVSLVEEISGISDSINEGIKRMADTIRHTSMGVCVHEEGSIREEDALTNEDAINLRYKTGSQPPQWISPAPFGPSQVQWIQMQVDKIHDLSGVSEMTATAQRPSGLTAGVAIRTIEDVQSKRFAVILRAYEESFVSLARHTIACAREIANEDPEFAVHWPGKSFLQTIKWKDVDLKDQQYIIQLYPTSSIKNTPADRLQLIQELNAAGKVSDEALIETIKYLDSQKELDGVSKQRELIESYIEAWQDATAEKQQKGEFVYRAPIPWMPSLPDALIQVANAYLDAELNEIPDFNKDLFTRFMQELNSEIESKALRSAQIAQGIAPGSPPPAPGGPAPMAAPPAPPPGPPPQGPPFKMPPEDIQVAATSTIAPAVVGTGSAPAKGDLVAKYASMAAKDQAIEDAAALEPEVKPAAKAKGKAEAKTAPKAAKIDPKTIKIDLEKPESLEAKPEPEGDIQAKARYYLQHGDVAKAIDTALGDLTGLAMPDDVREALARKLGVKSEQWEKVRKFEKSVKREAAAREQQVSQLVDQVRQEFAPLVNARAAYQAGDYETAFKAAFGEDLADFQRKAISQRVSKNPEVEQVKALLERERAERLADKQALAAEQEKALTQRDITNYVAELQTELAESPDPQVVRYAQRPRFVQRVFQIQAQNYDRATNTTMPTHKAAEIARDEILGLLNEWEYSPGEDSAQSDQAAALPANPPRAKAPVRNLKHSQAAEALTTPRKLTRAELHQKYSKLITLSPES